MTQLTLSDYLIGIILFLAGILIVWGIFNINPLVCWINGLTRNEIQILGNIIQVLGVVLAALVGLWVTFSQIRKQFELKVIHTAWKDFQLHLFEFSSTLSEYSSKVSWLTYFINTQNNPIVNGGNLTKYRTDKWNDLNDSQYKMMHSLVLLLRSFETHEIIFLSLRKMKNAFNEECNEITGVKYMNFVEVIFPEFFAQSLVKTHDEQIEVIKAHWNKTMDITTYLDDFRRELQNETIGKILSKKLERRIPAEACQILTKDGLVDFRP